MPTYKDQKLNILIYVNSICLLFIFCIFVRGIFTGSLVAILWGAESARLFVYKFVSLSGASIGAPIYKLPLIL